MSIIYDALKKIGGTEKLTAQPLPIAKPPTAPQHKHYLIYMLAIVGVIIFAVLLLNPFSKVISPAPVIEENIPALLPVATEPALNELSSLEQEASPVEEPVKEEPAPPQLVLNGVFISDKDTYALVNNEIVKVGDNIEGVIVRRIGVDEVDCEFEGKTITLRSGG